MKLIQLTKGKQAIVDDDDYEELNQFKWYSNNGYVCRAIKINGVYKTIPLHRTVNKTPIGLETDHINRNKLDNRKSNLRSVSRSINNFNKRNLIKIQINSILGPFMMIMKFRITNKQKNNY